MRFEWDEAKNIANIAKHGVGFDQVAPIFEGPIVSWTDTRLDYGEVRTLSIGQTVDRVVFVVVHTDRAGITRIISARLASRIERRSYFNAL